MKALRSLICSVLVCGLLAGPVLAGNVSTISATELQQLVSGSKGRVLIVAFWATWCSPCVKEFPGLVTVRKEIPESDLQMVGISLDHNVRAVENFVQQQQANFPIFMDGGDVSATFGVNSIPRTLIFSRSGEKVLDHLGFISEESFRHVVERVRRMP